jgi:hypothetical protein
MIAPTMNWVMSEIKWFVSIHALKALKKALREEFQSAPFSYHRVHHLHSVRKICVLHKLLFSVFLIYDH